MKAIKCDLCGATWPEDQPYSVHVETSVRLHGEPSEQDFCSWGCLAKYAAEREPHAAASVVLGAGVFRKRETANE